MRFPASILKRAGIEIISEEEGPPAKRAPSKYSNKTETADGYTFDSKVEMARYHRLKLLAAAGEISDLVIHPVYELQPGFNLKDSHRKIQAIHYEGDFAYTENGRRVCEDVKGVETDTFKLKKKMFLFRYPEIELRIIPAEPARKPGRPRKDVA